MRRFGITILSFVALGLSVARAQVVNGIRAVVHDAVITYDQVEELIPPVIYRTYASDPQTLQKKLVESRNEILEQLVARQLILHDFKTAGYNIPETILNDEVQSRIRQEYEDQMNLHKALQAKGTTYEKFRQDLRDRIIISVLRQKNISSEIIISPHKVEAYYLAHKDEYKIEDEVKLRRIVLNKATDSDPAQTRKLAEEILSRLKDGATFAEMASLYSQGPEKKDGGLWGWVERPVLRKELADVAFTLKAGDRSDIIETPEACYILQVEEKKSSHIKTLGEVRDTIEKNLLSDERNRLEKQWIERLKKKTFVQYF